MTQFDQRNQQVNTQYNADQITIQQQPLSLTEKKRKQNRARMLQRVQAIWIEGIFEPSLQEAAQIALQVQKKPSAVVTPLWSVLREFDTTGQLSSENASIVQVYDHASGEVLLLGEPGSGKTTLLLELTRTLLERARQDEGHPIPVVFPLSSWATKRQPLTTWLASELHTKYQIPLALATSWIEMDQVLPLLDGLDEVTSAQQAACVEAINTYRREHGLLPTVVCSRQTDYLALTTRLLLRTAVVVQPLTPEQVASYLASGGERLEALHQILREDTDLRTLASTPLMLNVLTAAYQGTPPQEITTTGSLGMKQEQVFASYVQRMLTHRNTSTRYTPQQTMHWLSYLASQMKRQSQTIFYIEQMQPDWLSGVEMRRDYDRWALRFPAILMGILVSLTFNSILAPVPFFSYTSLTLNIVLGGFIGWLLSAENTIQQPHESSKRVKRDTGSRLVRQLRAGAFIGLGAGLITGLIAGLFGWLSFGVFGGLISGLSNGLSFGLGFGLSAGLLSGLLTGKPVGIILTDELNWSWRSLGRSLFAKRHIYTALSVMALIVLITGLNVALTNKLIIGLSNGLIIGLSNGLIDGLISGLSNGLLVGLSLWLLLGFFQGVSSETIEDQRRVVPNQGIRRSARNSLVFGLISTGIVLLSFVLSTGLVVGLGVAFFSGGILSYTMSGGPVAEMEFVQKGGLFGELSTGLDPTLGFVLSIGLSAAPLAGLLYGGLACLRHGVIRLLLWHDGSIPWNYPRFLDTAYEQILLRKVGGGYIFLHRLLLDYFADLEAGSDSKVLAEDSQEILPLESVSSTSAEPSEADSYVDAPTVEQQ